MKFFLQINASEEKSKSGFSPLLVLDEVRLISQLPAIELIGLMTIASITGSPVTTFRKLKKLSEEMGLKELSMGMSADYLIALEEGATFLRIGSSIFDI
jgi:PLP dependent protein